VAVAAVEAIVGGIVVVLRWWTRKFMIRPNGTPGADDYVLLAAAVISSLFSLWQIWGAA